MEGPLKEDQPYLTFKTKIRSEKVSHLAFSD